MIQNNINYLPRIFNNLTIKPTAKTSSKKENSLKLLTKIIQNSQNSQNTKNFHFHQKIVFLILSHIDDLTIPLRDEALQLFLFISPSILIPHLIENLKKYYKNSRIRSFLIHFYQTILLESKCKNPIEMIQSLLCCIRHFSSLDSSFSNVSFQNPSNIGKEIQSNSISDENNGEIVKILLKPISNWVNQLSSFFHNEFLSFFVQTFFDHPESSEIVSFASQCSSFFASHSLYLIQIINEKMKLSTKENPKNNINVFNKLSPLLLLRILPLGVYQMNNFCEILNKNNCNFEYITLIDHLLDLYSNSNELKELRRLATEILARFPCFYLINNDLIISKVFLTMNENFFIESNEILQFFNSNQENFYDFDTIKLCIFYYCNVMNIYCPIFNDSSLFEERIIPIFKCLFDLLKIPSVNDEIQKLQQGCMDAIGILFFNSLHVNNNLLFQQILNYIFTVHDIEGNTIKLLSSIIKIIPKFSIEQMNNFFPFALSKSLSFIYNNRDSNDINPTLIVGLLQFVFVIVFHAKENLDHFISDLFSCALDACKHSIAKVSFPFIINC